MKTKLQKTLLKEKLLNYQQQIQNQSTLQINAENIDSQRSQGNYYFLKDLNTTSRITQNQAETQAYLKYLSQFTFKGDNNCIKSELSRQNIQSMNKKTRIIRSSYYQSPSNFQLAIKISNSPYKEHIRRSLNSKKSKTINVQNYGNMSQRLYKSKQISQKLSPFLTIKQSKCQTIERPYEYIRRSSSAMTSRKTSKNMDRAKTAQQIRREQTLSSKNPQIQKNLIAMGKDNSQNDMGLILNNFKPKLKAKYLEDNIKVMANIMKRKIGSMNGDQIYKYVNKISQKRQPFQLWSSKQCQKVDFHSTKK